MKTRIVMTQMTGRKNLLSEKAELLLPGLLWKLVEKAAREKETEVYQDLLLEAHALVCAAINGKVEKIAQRLVKELIEKEG